MKKKLLYVDDEAINLKLFELSFSGACEVVVCESPVEALKLFSEHSFDAVISDMNMPEMSGVDFIRQAAIDHPSIDYYILSGYQENENISVALKEGLIRKFFTKPFDRKQILAVITAE